MKLEACAFRKCWAIPEANSTIRDDEKDDAEHCADPRLRFERFRHQHQIMTQSENISSLGGATSALFSGCLMISGSPCGDSMRFFVPALSCASHSFHPWPCCFHAARWRRHVTFLRYAAGRCGPGIPCGAICLPICPSAFCSGTWRPRFRARRWQRPACGS